ncbi:MAG: hypothetical protein IPH12_02615 [Saprospirales bacterium]|nr:hypothetical protein [Saprospirales bacterium]
MSPEERTAQIEAWLDGTLDAEARAAFAASLRDDPALAVELALHERLRQAVREKSAGDFRQQLDSLLGEHRAGTARIPSLRRFWLPRYSWALAAALLLAVAVWFWFPAGPAPEDLYAQAFQPPTRFYHRSVRHTADSMATAPADPTWVRLDSAWAAAGREQALRLALEISRAETDTQSRLAALYAAGVIALADQQPEAAILHLKNAEGSKLYREEIVWYTALAQVQLALRDRERTGAAIQALENVKKGSQPEERYLMAEKLLESLRRQR